MHRCETDHAGSDALVPASGAAQRRRTGALHVALTLGALVAGGAVRAQDCASPPRLAAIPPVQITPVTLRPLQTVIYPVPATDGLIHLAYAAQLTNVNRGQTEILGIVPVDPLNQFKPTGHNRVLDVDDQQITGKVRLFAPPHDPPRQDFSQMPGGASGITFFDVTYKDEDDLPDLVAHRIEVGLEATGAPLIELTSPTCVSRHAPVVLAPPLSGHRWWNGNGCCEVVGPHRGATLPINGDIRPPEQFAIDWVQLTEQNTCCTGPVKKLSSWPFFGAPIFAVAPGKIVELVDGEPEQVPGPPVGVTADNAPGNHIIQDIGEGRYVLYAHIHTGSIPADLHVGDILATGRKIGEIGNTGSSTAPHLHFQVMDRPSALNAVGLPFVFDHQLVEGRVLGTLEATNAAYEAGRPVRTDTVGAGGRTGKMPAERQIFAFPAP